MQISRWIGGKFLRTALRTKIISLVVMLHGCSSFRRIDCHSTNWIAYHFSLDFLGTSMRRTLSANACKLVLTTRHTWPRSFASLPNAMLSPHNDVRDRKSSRLNSSHVSE